MDILLTQSVAKLGQKGEVVKVAPGYGRHLINQKKAVLADAKIKARLKEQNVKAKEQVKKRTDSIRSALRDLRLFLTAKANEKGHLFKAVHERDIVDAIAKQAGIDISDRDIKIEKDIKELGEFEVKVILPDASYEIVIVNIKKED